MRAAAQRGGTWLKTTSGRGRSAGACAPCTSCVLYWQVRRIAAGHQLQLLPSCYLLAALLLAGGGLCEQRRVMTHAAPICCAGPPGPATAPRDTPATLTPTSFACNIAELQRPAEARPRDCRAMASAWRTHAWLACAGTHGRSAAAAPTAAAPAPGAGAAAAAGDVLAVRGSGSTAVAALMNALTANFNKVEAQAAVTYDAVGSSQGAPSGPSLRGPVDFLQAALRKIMWPVRVLSSLIWQTSCWQLLGRDGQHVWATSVPGGPESGPTPPHRRQGPAVLPPLALDASKSKQ